MANAEGVKGAAEAYRYGSLLGCNLEEVANSVEARLRGRRPTRRLGHRPARLP
jgi:hypothetical protein